MSEPPAVAGAPERRHRAIRSFVLRQGRLTPAQERAMQLHWPRFGAEYQGAPVDWDGVFGRHAERVLEIGFGNGEALAHAVQSEPERDFIGIEVHRPGVGRLLNAVAAAEARNVRVYCHDAVEVLTHDLPPGALSEVRIWFPDPWHKKRHHKRRLIQSAFLDLLATRIRAGGLLHLATDWQAYAEHMIDTVERHPAFRNQLGPGQSTARPPWRIPTHFEQRGQRLGHGVWDLLYLRRE